MAARWVIDGMNVIGSRPTGWWKDLDGAIRSFLDELRIYAERTGDRITVVFDHRPHGLSEGAHGGVEVAFPSRAGRNAADDEIVRLLSVEPAPSSIRVVTSDTALAERVSALGAQVVGAGTFRRALDEALDPPVSPA